MWIYFFFLIGVLFCGFYVGVNVEVVCFVYGWLGRFYSSRFLCCLIRVCWVVVFCSCCSY